MRGRAIRPTIGPLVLHLGSADPSGPPAFLRSCRYHLLHNVIPTLLIFVGVAGIALVLGMQIDRARSARQEPAAALVPAWPQETAGAARVPTGEGDASF